MRTRLGSAKLLLLLFCVLAAVALAWIFKQGEDAAPFSISFVGVTNGIPRYPGPQGVFAVTNRSSITAIVACAHWYYENGTFSPAIMSTNKIVRLKPRDGRLLTFGDATNSPCRLTIGWMPALAHEWLKVPLAIREKLPRRMRGVQVREQTSDWIRERALINATPTDL